jgi:hypothetical protein
VSVEIDLSDVQWGSYYKDEKCKELERTLQSNPEYSECEVKRAHWHDESTDPFHVLDERGEEIIVLERWEVNALSASEIMTYIEVQRNRNQGFGWLDAVLYGLLIAIGSMAVGFHIYSLPYLSYSLPPPWMILLDLVSLLLGIFCILRYGDMKARKKNLDLEAVRIDPSFLDILRKLADVPKTENPKKEEFVKRLALIEDTLAGTNS